MIIKFKIRTVALVIAIIYSLYSLISVDLRPNILANSDETGSFAIIMYHHITNNDKKAGDYVITVNQLEEDFKYLKENGYKTLLVRDLYSIDKGETFLPEKSVMLTFDDGQKSFYKYAYPLLEKYGFKAVFSVIGKYAEDFSNSEDDNIEYAHSNYKELKEMSESVIVEIGNHSFNMHNNSGNGRSGVTKKSGESFDEYKRAIVDDIETFNSFFIKNLGFAPNFFTYPFGRFSDDTEKIIKELGFSAALTCYEHKNTPKSSEDWLYKLGRYNRSGKQSSRAFFRKIGI